MKQWVIDTPRFAEDLLAGLDDLDWPESTKEIQRNWIGKSVGAEVDFSVAGQEDLKFTVFTTRADTLFGATYCVLAPEHELVKKITTAEQKDAIEQYIKEAASKSDMERPCGCERRHASSRLCVGHRASSSESWAPWICGSPACWGAIWRVLASPFSCFPHSVTPVDN